MQIADRQVSLARGREREWFVHRFRTRCAELDVNVVENGPHLRLTATDRIAAPGERAGP